MTTLTTKPVIRESYEKLDRRNTIITLGPGNLISFRAKGRRKAYETTIGACADMAIKQYVFAEKKRKAAERKARREGR